MSKSTCNPRKRKAEDALQFLSDLCDISNSRMAPVRRCKDLVKEEKAKEPPERALGISRDSIREFLIPGSFTSDFAMTTLIEWIAKALDDALAATPHANSVFFMNTLQTSFLEQPTVNLKKFGPLNKWLRSSDVATHGIIVVPVICDVSVSIKTRHFVCMIVDFYRSRIEYWDSLKSFGWARRAELWRSHMARWLAAMFAEKLGPFKRPARWRFIAIRDCGDQDKTKGDCGPFVLANALNRTVMILQREGKLPKDPPARPIRGSDIPKWRENFISTWTVETYCSSA